MIHDDHMHFDHVHASFPLPVVIEWSLETVEFVYSIESYLLRHARQVRLHRVEVHKDEGLMLEFDGPEWTFLKLPTRKVMFLWRDEKDWMGAIETALSRYTGGAYWPLERKVT